MADRVTKNDRIYDMQTVDCSLNGTAVETMDNKENQKSRGLDVAHSLRLIKPRRHAAD
jgi:hypothetical protein